MTPTSPSTAAGSEKLVQWLRRARDCPAAAGLVLRGSVVLRALIAEARTPVDVDYLAPGKFDAAATEKLAREIAPITGTLVIYGETRFPGLRVFWEELQIDFGFGDPLPVPPRAIEIAEVGPIVACTAETLFGWKVHGLVEHGRGHWRAKDLFDLWLMWTRLTLDRDAVKSAVHLAFDSRGTPIGDLDDFLTRPDWGQSRGGGRKWRVLVADKSPFLETLEIVRKAVVEILG